MSYIALIALLAGTVVAALAAFVVAIVFACKKRWPRALIAACTIFLCGLLAVGAGIGLAAKAAGSAARIVKREVAAFEADVARREAEIEAKRVPKINAIKALIPAVDWTRIDNQWWTYEGFRDWWRVPVRWPYEVMSLDRLDEGNLCRNAASGKSEFGQISQIQDVFHLKNYACDEKFFVFRQVEEGTERWGSFEFDTDAIQKFDTEAELWASVESKGWKHQRTMKTVKQNYEDYWR